ncbi:MAG: secretion system protein E, partial [Dehalococcoidia bacterium]|nr:secretion system protein E [Dehalococcoidia bacterium]
MTQLAVPTINNDVHNHENPDQCSLMPLLPPPLQAACQENVHLLKYLHLLPLQEVGFPSFHTSLNRKMGDAQKHNLIYQVSQDILIHIFSDPK